MFDEDYWSKKEKEENAKRFIKFAYKLREVPRPRTLLLILLFSFVAFMWMYVFVFIANDDYLKSILKTYTFFHLEFAFTPDQVNLIFAQWGLSDAIFRNILINILDFPFIVSYVIILTCISIFAMRQLKDKYLNVGLRLIYLPILAGILDCIQDIFLLIMLINGSAINFIFPLLVSILAIIKYGLMFGTVGFVIFTIVIKILYYFQIIQEGK